MPNPSVSVEFGKIKPGFTDGINQQLLNYYSFRQGTHQSYRTAETHFKSIQEMMATSAHYVQHELPTDVLQTRTNDPQLMSELATREWTGFGTPENRDLALARWTFLATEASNVLRRIRARVHSCLSAAWLDRGTEDRQTWNIDSLYRAGSNANEAISLGLISPATLRTGSVIENAGFRRAEDNRFLAHNTDRFERLNELWEALDMRKEEVDGESAERDAKVSKDPLKYVCSAEDCGIQATKRSGLLRCAGKCQVASKPSYCSKECQKMDWKRHKPFCKAEVTGSTVDSLHAEVDAEDEEKIVQRATLSHDVASDTFEGRAAGHSIDVPMKDGSTMRLNSETLGPKTLRGIRKFTEDNL